MTFAPGIVRLAVWLVLISLGGLMAGPASSQSFSDIQFPYVQFRNAPALPLIAFQQGRPEEDGRKAEMGNLWARLALQPARAPMVILMHGCGGVGNTPTQDWIKGWGSFFWKKGFSVMAIDSFTSRSVKNTCGQPDEHWSYRRRDDAYSALVYLSAQGRTDMNNVVVMGRSNGGRTVLRILEAKMSSIRPHRFARGIAMYPFCGRDIATRYYAPLQVFVGDQDDANPARFCVEMAHTGDPNLTVRVFPGVFHGFDDGSKYRTEFGWRMGGDAKATDQVRQAIDAALGR